MENSRRPAWQMAYIGEFFVILLKNKPLGETKSEKYLIHRETNGD